MSGYNCIMLKFPSQCCVMNRTTNIEGRESIAHVFSPMVNVHLFLLFACSYNRSTAPRSSCVQNLAR